MKALGIVAGPRKNQLTDRLTDSALAGLSARPAATEKIYLIDLTLKPCMGCCACQKLGRCVINDDFNALAEKVREADVLVFSSPTYISNVTSCAKRFFDRGYSLFKEGKFGPVYHHDKPKKAILITSCGAPFPFDRILGITPGSVGAMKAFFRYMRVKMKLIVATGARDYDAKAHAALMGKAYDTGKTF